MFEGNHSHQKFFPDARKSSEIIIPKETCRTSLLNVVPDEGKKKAREKLEELRYSDIGFTAHIPPKTLELLGLQSREVNEQLIKELCADQRVVKIVNIHGWNASREIWEINSGGKSWTQEQIDLLTAQGIPVIVLNIDSNGWGETKITENGQEVLKRGKAAGILQKWIDNSVLKLSNRINLSENDSEDGDQAREELLHSDDLIANLIRMSMQYHELGEINYRSFDNSVIVDTFSRDSMPGSISFASDALILLLTALDVRGDLFLIGHSQGGRIITDFLNKRNLRSGSPFAVRNARVFAIDVASAHTGGELKDSFTYFFKFLEFLQSKYGRILTRIDRAMGINFTEIIGMQVTKLIALKGMPKKLSQELSKLHAQQISLDTIRQLVSQAFAWQSPDLSEVADTSQLHFRGKEDVLTPNEDFRLWAIRSRASLNHPAFSGVDEYVFNEPSLHVEQLDGPHYFQLIPQNQNVILSHLLEIATITRSPDIEKVRELLDVIDTLDGCPLMFCVVNEDVVNSSLIERMETALAWSSDAKDHGAELFCQVPVSQTELTALYPDIATHYSKFSAQAQRLDDSSLSSSRRFFVAIAERLRRHTFTVDKDNFAYKFDSRHSSMIVDTIKLFPYQLFMVDIESKVDNLKTASDVQNYISEKSALFEREFGAWLSRSFLEEEVERYQLSPILDFACEMAKEYFVEQLSRLAADPKRLVYQSVPPVRSFLEL